jgi:hypothetical protein
VRAFVEAAKRVFAEGLPSAVLHGDAQTDYRAALCRWEDDLFRSFPEGHGLLSYDEACELIRNVFAAWDRPPPTLRLVAGFDDPRIGAYADIRKHEILVERGYLYRFLVLHECAHLLVPQDRMHGPAFTYMLQFLYRSVLGIPEEPVRDLLHRHELPAFTALPAS